MILNIFHTVVYFTFEFVMCLRTLNYTFYNQNLITINTIYYTICDETIGGT